MMGRKLIDYSYIRRVSSCLLIAGMYISGCSTALATPAGGTRAAGASKSLAGEKPAGTAKAATAASGALKKTTSNIYGQIADDGLSGTIGSGNLAIIKAACDEEHSDPDGKNWSDDADGGVGRFFKFMDRETSKTLNLAASADTNSEDRAKALHHFGLILRGLEEFYLMSNYLELKAESSDRQLDPYNIDPINWTKIGKDPRSIAMTGFKFGEFDKSTAQTPEGAKMINKASYFSMARELAVKETSREWNTVERLIRVRYPQRAAEIMVALKNATCPSGIKFDSDE